MIEILDFFVTFFSALSQAIEIFWGELGDV